MGRILYFQEDMTPAVRTGPALKDDTLYIREFRPSHRLNGPHCFLIPLASDQLLTGRVEQPVHSSRDPLPTPDFSAVASGYATYQAEAVIWYLAI